MDYLQRLVVACIFASGSAHAAYAQLSPPAGWSKVGSAAWATPANSYASNAATKWIGNAAKTSAMLNVGGRQIAVNASLMLSANAPRVAAAVIHKHPAIRIATGVAAFLGLASITWDEDLQSWVKPGGDGGDVPDRYEYRVNNFTGRYYFNKSSACTGHVATLLNSDVEKNHRVIGTDPRCLVEFDSYFSGSYKGVLTHSRNYQSRLHSCPAGSYNTEAGCSTTLPPKVLTEEEFIEELAPHPIPSTLPFELPKVTPLPVELPQIDPLFVPTGDPVRNPNFNPNLDPGPNNEPWLQPGTRVTPRPTVNDPWQVDLQPVDRPQSGPDPLPETELNPQPDERDRPRDEDTKSLCEKHPDILACQKVTLGDLEPSELSQNTVSLQINREEGFGPANGACPAPKQFTIMGKSMAFQWDLLCDFASQIRPLLIGFAYLSAALAFFGLSRKD